MKNNHKIHLKTEEEIKKMRTSGKLASQVIEMIEHYVKPGVTTNELNKVCHDFITIEQKAIPAPLNYKGFPKSICTSINHQVCHGIPDDKPLKKGDIVNIDVTVIKNGFHGDTSKMFIVGEGSILAKRLINVAQECLYKAIKLVKPGVTLGDIGYIIQQHAHANHFSIVREFCGHGIGLNFHEPPQVLHYGRPGDGYVLEEGLTFTIEPMLNAGKRFVKTLQDQWTVVTKDRSLSAQWEHTILVTKSGCEILTLRKDEKIT